MGANNPPDRSVAHRLYWLSLAAKGLIGALQLVAGGLLVAMPGQAVSAIVTRLAALELVEDPADPAAHLVTSLISGADPGQGDFYSAYLLIHGLLNLGVVVALMARIGWAFPVSIAVLAGFVAYQLYKYSAGGGIMMLILSAVDVVVILLALREWRLHKQIMAERPDS